MVELIAVTIISCNDLMSILYRLSAVVGLSYQQKVEVIQVLKETVPNCPIIIEKNDRRK